MRHDFGTNLGSLSPRFLVSTPLFGTRQFARRNRARLFCENAPPRVREIAARARVRPLASVMKLSPLAHQAGAHDDGAWAVAWCKSSDGDDLLLTGSVDESVRSWRATGDGLEVVHEYQGACGDGRVALFRTGVPCGAIERVAPATRDERTDAVVDAVRLRGIITARPTAGRIHPSSQAIGNDASSREDEDVVFFREPTNRLATASSPILNLS